MKEKWNYLKLHFSPEEIKECIGKANKKIQAKIKRATKNTICQKCGATQKRKEGTLLRK